MNKTQKIKICRKITNISFLAYEKLPFMALTKEPDDEGWTKTLHSNFTSYSKKASCFLHFKYPHEFLYNSILNALC